MNCQRFEQVVSELARGQMMEADVRAEALAHSDQCENCATRLADEEKLSRGLQFLAADMESLAAPDSVELKLREAFRQRHVAVPVAANSANSSTSRYWLVAVAATLLVVMGVLGMWLRSGEPEKNVADNTQQKPIEAPAGPSGPTSPTTPAGPIEAAPEKTDAQADNRAVKRQTPKLNRRPSGTRRTPETQMANHASNEIATDFMPLGDANALVLQEGGQIIRVKLPRSTLVRFGFPVNMDRYNENVKADVIVGVDGLARAIRFVQ